MIISVTGHRPNKLNNDYEFKTPLLQKIADKISDVYLQYKPSRVNIGMALGIDQLSAIVAIGMNIPFIAAVPFKGQELAWPTKSQILYHQLLAKAAEVVIVSTGGYASWKMQARNKWLVDQLWVAEDRLLAIWDGTPGGTSNTVEYAIEQHRQIIRINPNSLEYGTE